MGHYTSDKDGNNCISEQDSCFKSKSDSIAKVIEDLDTSGDDFINGISKWLKTSQKEIQPQHDFYQETDKLVEEEGNNNGAGENGSKQAWIKAIAAIDIQCSNLLKGSKHTILLYIIHCGAVDPPMLGLRLQLSLLLAREVLTLLRQHKLFSKKRKCSFRATIVEYPRYIISKGSVAMFQSKVQSMLHWPTPQSVKDLRASLGLSMYCRRFVKLYGLLAKPLIDLLKKDHWQWSDSAGAAFQQLKQALCSAPILTSLLDFTQDFEVEIDVSGLGVSVVLQQWGRPMAYFSKASSLIHMIRRC
ncbi:Retrovirus-related Pol polyprotein from transposon 297 family [Gossypium australe]|uniref:Retrovirus-related Pol polyprotein from transposon 297 family n=1 Tax=Gossypium australe TaxID=47621 RepID=A0A5B6VTD4_9ROSI|nr:Retrovirus-related Pol polyprotein from transposon 297 family [Gossypium australe]